MKKLFLIFVIFISFCNVSAKENKYPSEIKEVLKVFINCLNNGDEDVYNLVDSNNKDLISDIENRIDDIEVTYDIKYIKSKGENYYRIKTIFSASGDHWSTNGFSSWFDIKLIDGTYKIADTNLFNKVGQEYIVTLVIFWFAAALCIFFAPFIILIFNVKRSRKVNNNAQYLSNQNKPL